MLGFGECGTNEVNGMIQHMKKTEHTKKERPILLGNKSWVSIINISQNSGDDLKK